MVEKIKSLVQTMESLFFWGLKAGFGAVLLLTAAIIFYNVYISLSIDREEKAFQKKGCKQKSSEFSGDGKPPAFLLIHGFSNTPYDMKPVALKLERLGFAYKAILLPGHGTSPRQLRCATARKWTEKADREYNLLKKRYGSVSIAGFSIGGDIALDIAARQEVSRLVIISPFFKFKEKWFGCGLVERLLRWLQPVLPYVKKIRVGMINDPEKLRQYHAYWHVPLACLDEVFRVAETSVKKAENVKSDTLWIHSRGDMVADFAASREVFKKLPSRNKQFVEFRRSDHVVLHDYDSEAAVERIVAFIRDDKTDRVP